MHFDITYDFTGFDTPAGVIEYLRELGFPKE